MEIREHAILYALIGKAVFDHCNRKEAEDLIRKITVSYGMKRGRRMRENSETGDLGDFFINGEWQGKEGENISSLRFEEGRTVSEVKKCAWYDTWKETGLLEYGSYYCRCIDKAICEGYDSSFSLDVQKTLGQGDPCCLFVWNEAADENRIKHTEKRRIRDFGFHCRELFDTAMEILPEEMKETIYKEIRDSFQEMTGQTI